MRTSHTKWVIWRKYHQSAYSFICRPDDDQMNFNLNLKPQVRVSVRLFGVWECGSLLTSSAASKSVELRDSRDPLRSLSLDAESRRLPSGVIPSLTRFTAWGNHWRAHIHMRAGRQIRPLVHTEQHATLTFQHGIHLRE